MSVEVRQLIVKSSLVQSGEVREEARAGESVSDREEILEECRRLILETLRELRER